MFESHSICCQDNFSSPQHPEPKRNTEKNRKKLVSGLPEDNVTVSSDVLPPVDDVCPLGSRPDAEHGAAAVREGLEVPILAFKHVMHAISAHGHHHLGARLQTRDRICWHKKRKKKGHHDGKNLPLETHLVVPAQEAQAAGGRLRRVETGSAPGVVVVDLGRLRDAVKQLAFGGGGAQVQVLAHGLRFQQAKSRKL